MQADAPKILSTKQRTKIETRIGYRFRNFLLLDQMFLGEGDAAEINAGRKPGRYVQDKVSLAYAGKLAIRRVQAKFGVEIDLTDPSLRPAFRGIEHTSSAEALVGAVALDCGYNLNTIANVICLLLLSSWHSFCQPCADKMVEAVSECPA